MRMTVTLDNDVARLLRREMRRSGASLKTTVNYSLRVALMPSTRPPAKRFVVHPRPLGLPAGLSYDSVQNLLAALESPLDR